MKEILIFKPGILNDDIRTELRTEGFIVIETDEPEPMRRISPDMPTTIGGDEMFADVIRAVSGCGSGSAKMHVFDAIAATLQRQVARNRPKPSPVTQPAVKPKTGR